MPYTVNGEAVNIEHEPRVKDGVMWVPFRPLATALGAQVDFEPSTRAPLMFLGSDVVTLVAGSSEVDINGEKQQLSAAPFIYEGETFVPARLFEMLPNVQLNADPNTLQVDIMQMSQA